MNKNSSFFKNECCLIFEFTVLINFHFKLINKALYNSYEYNSAIV